MNIITGDYNNTKITFPEAITIGQDTVVGTIEDFDKLVMFASRTGVVQVDITITVSTTDYPISGTFLVNNHSDGTIELVNTWRSEDNPVANKLIGILIGLNEEDNCVCNISYTSI